jgi:hypothetical protein
MGEPGLLENLARRAGLVPERADEVEVLGSLRPIAVARLPARQHPHEPCCEDASGGRTLASD